MIKEEPIKKMSREELIEKIKTSLEHCLDPSEAPRLMPNNDVMVVFKAESLSDAMGCIAWGGAFEFGVLMNHLGVDYGDRFGVIYNLYSPKHKQKITVKAYLGREKPEVQSLEPLFRGINWYERETYDMLGIVFKHHSNLKRLLLPEDWVGFPLRKDYVYPETYGGHEHSRPDLLDLRASERGEPDV